MACTRRGDARNKARWWCPSGTKCSASNLELHRHPFGNDLKKCHDFVLETGIQLCLVHVSREEADNETRRALNARAKEPPPPAAMARGGVGAGASKVAAASTGTTAASTDVAATAHRGESVGNVAATTGRLGAEAGEGAAKDDSDEDSDGRGKDCIDGARDGTVGPGQDGKLGSAASPAGNTRDERSFASKTVGVKCSHSTSKPAASHPGEAAGPSVTAARRAKIGGKLISGATPASRTSDGEKSSARKTVGVKRSHVSKPAASQPGEATRPTLTAARRAKIGGKLISGATPASRTSDGKKSSARKTVGVKRSHVSKPAASQPGEAARPTVVAAKPEQEDKVGDAPPRVGGTSRLKPASVARRNTGTVVAKVRSPKSPLRVTKSSSSTRTKGNDIKISSAMSRSSADRKGEDLKTSPAMRRARRPTAEDGPSHSSGRPSSRKTVGVKRSHSTVSKPAASQPGEAAGPPVTAARGAKKGGKLVSAATTAKRVAEDCPSELTAKARKDLLPPSASVPRPSGASTAPTKAPARAIRSYPPAKLSPVQWERTAQAPRPIIGRSYGSAFVPWRPRAREADFQPQLVRTGTSQPTPTVTRSSQDALPPKRKYVSNEIRPETFRVGRDVQPTMRSRWAYNSMPGRSPSRHSSRLRFGGERSRQRVLEPAASQGGASANPWLQRRPVVAAEEQDDRFSSAISLRSVTGSCRLLPVARRAINSSITRSCRLAQRAINSSITHSYRLLPVARRLVAGSVTSSRVRLTPMARRATSMANELVRAAGRSVRNAMAPTPRDQEPAKSFFNRTLSVPHPSNASAAAGARRDVAPATASADAASAAAVAQSSPVASPGLGRPQTNRRVDNGGRLRGGDRAEGRPCVAHRSILHYEDELLQICDMCGRCRTRLRHHSGSYQCHACPADLCGLCGQPGTRHYLHADRIRPGHPFYIPPRSLWVRKTSPTAAPSTLPAVAPPTAPTGRAVGFGSASVAAPPSGPLVRRSPPAAVPSTPPAVGPPTAPTGRVVRFGSASVAAPPSPDPSPMDVDDLTPAATPAHATGFIFGGISAIGTGVATVSMAPTPMVVASPTSAAARRPPSSFIFTGNQPGAHFTFVGGAASATRAAATTTTSMTAVLPTRVSAINAPPLSAGASASVATVSTAPTPRVVASPSFVAPQPRPASSTFTGNGAQFTFGGGAASATKAAATTTTTTTGPFPGPTLTAGRVAPHGPGGCSASSAVPVPSFIFGTGGVNGGIGAVTAPPAPAGASAFVAPASLAGGVGSAQGTGAVPLPPVGLTTTQAGGVPGVLNHPPVPSRALLLAGRLYSANEAL
ncbi:hypothetical protein Esi_0104_0013 [Ectocarpus siliculosus]|uniref:Uncharacterized protein n=1 Tax=Ectocarpus siliculosus TaxID=2880 RepID=D7FGZ6_ECTSI|nr:hypothetical protein Esi_0104_0013 [Ectocarpus siliculosus]|eukprot:CBJ28374.1 hypothetical protein Esi_0104_0013 [Ectocarpus siliculosus]